MIEVEHLTKRFGGLTALEDLDFAVRPGRVTGLLGPNGAGKTTTMSIVLGLLAPTSGRATVAGRPYRELDQPLRHVGALLDADAVQPSRSAHAHLTWVAQTNHIDRGRVEAVLQLVGLEAVADKHLSGYSLGMKQRLGIAQALLGDAPVLVFDEPANGLDPEGILWVRGFFRQLAAEGRTVLLSLPWSWGDAVGRFSLLAASYELVSPERHAHLLPVWVSLVVVLAWPAVALVGGGLLLQQRDV